MVVTRPTTATSSRWRNACSVHAASLPPLHDNNTGVRMPVSSVARTDCAMPRRDFAHGQWSGVATGTWPIPGRGRVDGLTGGDDTVAVRCWRCGAHVDDAVAGDRP